MGLLRFLTGGRQSGAVRQILRNQLLWMLTLRVVLYTLLLIISYLFIDSEIDLILMPIELHTLLLAAVYLVTIFSVLFLILRNPDLRRFGFIQSLIDTIFVTLLVYYTGVSASSFTTVYFFPIISGGLILPRKGGLMAAAASTLLYGFILGLELLGTYPPYLDHLGINHSIDPIVSLNRFSIHGLTFFLAAILSALFSMRIKSTENALSDSLRNYDRLAELYKLIFDNITTGIITIDSSSLITSANNATAKITGYTQEMIVGKYFSDRFPTLSLDYPKTRQSADFTKVNGDIIRLGYSHVDMATLTGADQGAIGQNKIITLQDISEVEQLEKQMRQAEKLAAIGMMSASIAHDFRNPLTAISGSAQILANDLSKEGSKSIGNYELTDIILRESGRMIDTISDFLKFSRPESANREWFSLAGCLEEVVQVCTAVPGWPTSADLIVEIDDKMDIWGDQKQVFTVLNHLITNSIAFCPPGEEIIEVLAREIKNEGETDGLEIVVSDNGPGVAAELMEKVFEPFYTSRADGTGLGLAIILQIMEEHSGTVTVTRGHLGGAEFKLLFPLPQD